MASPVNKPYPKSQPEKHVPILIVGLTAWSVERRVLLSFKSLKVHRLHRKVRQSPAKVVTCTSMAQGGPSGFSAPSVSCKVFSFTVWSVKSTKLPKNQAVPSTPVKANMDLIIMSTVSTIWADIILQQGPYRAAALLVWCLGDFAKRWPINIKISYDIMTFSRLRAIWLQFNCQLSSITFNNNIYSAPMLENKAIPKLPTWRSIVVRFHSRPRIFMPHASLRMIAGHLQKAKNWSLMRSKINCDKLIRLLPRHMFLRLLSMYQSHLCWNPWVTPATSNVQTLLNFTQPHHLLGVCRPISILRLEAQGDCPLQTWCEPLGPGSGGRTLP